MHEDDYALCNHVDTPHYTPNQWIPRTPTPDGWLRCPRCHTDIRIAYRLYPHGVLRPASCQQS